MNVMVHERWLFSPSDLVGLDPTRARDLIVECFLEAQHEAMTHGNGPWGEDRDPNLIRFEARNAVRNAFQRTGGDYDNPDKVSLVRVLGSLAETTSVLGIPRDIAEHQTQQIVMILTALPD